MHILWIKVGGLWPADTGGRLRTLHMLSELSRRHKVTLLTTHTRGRDTAPLRRRLPRCEVVSFPFGIPKWHSPRFPLALLRSWFSRLPVDLWKCRVPALHREAARRLEAGAVDVSVADFMVAVPNVPLDTPVPVVFFAHNVEYMIWKRLRDNASGFLRRALLEIEWRKMRRYEARTCARVPMTVAVSARDRDALAALAPGADIRAVDTGVDVGYFAPGGVAEKTDHLVYVGSMDWHPNEDAVVHFIEAVLPAVRREKPTVSLTVVGRNPSRRLRRLAAGAGVQVTGTVADIRPFVAEAAVVVVPLRVGGGTRLKLFEVLAMGKATVSTAIGAEGLPLVDGTHFRRADAPPEFAGAVLALLDNPERRRRLGRAGRELVERRYAWSEVTAQFGAFLEAAAGMGPPKAPEEPGKRQQAVRPERAGVFE